MKILYFTISMFVSGLVLCSCKKNVPDLDYPNERYCEKFAGKYLMFDPANNVAYQMECRCYINEDPQMDSIEFINFANKFELKYQLFNISPKNQLLVGTVIQPLYDYDSNRTSFSFAGNSISPPKNIIRNDSLYLNFNTNNFAYYLEDGTSWEICDNCQHYGVKIH